MPIYVYHCASCSETYEIYESIYSNPHSICIKCGNNTVSRQLFPPPIIGEARSLGVLAERNAAKMSDEEKAILDEKHRTKRSDALSKVLPQGASLINTVKTSEDKKERERIKKINKMTKEQKEKYIMTGKGL